MLLLGRRLQGDRKLEAQRTLRFVRVLLPPMNVSLIAPLPPMQVLLPLGEIHVDLIAFG